MRPENRNEFNDRGYYCQEENLSMFESSVTPEMIKHQVQQALHLEKLERSNEKWQRQVEQTELLNYINWHAKRSKEK